MKSICCFVQLIRKHYHVSNKLVNIAFQRFELTTSLIGLNN